MTVIKTRICHHDIPRSRQRAEFSRSAAVATGGVVAPLTNNVQADKMEQAKSLAEEAEADADFADAISNTPKTAAAASELQAVQQKLHGKLQ